MKSELLNIAIVTTDEPFYLPVTLEKLFEGRWGNSIRAVILLPPTSKKRNWKNIIDEQLRFGIIYFTYRSFQYLFFKILSKLNIKLFNRYFSVSSVCKAYEVPCIKINNINSKESETILKNMNPHLLVSISASQIFSKKIIEIPTYATINVHNAPLPRYQGLMPSFWVLYNNEKQTATTVHIMAEKIDAGDIVIQKFVEINPDETLDSLIKKTKLLTVDALNEAFDLFCTHKGKPPLRHLELRIATYFSFPTKEDVREFRKKGKKLIWRHIY